MRTEERNPAYREYGHLLPPSGRYPARWVDIFWNSDANSKIKDVEVVLIPRDLKIPADNGYGRRMDIYMNKWTSDMGNSFTKWLRTPLLTPEGVFGALLRTGFSSETELRSTLEEFVHIEECEWARNMLTGFND